MKNNKKIFSVILSMVLAIGMLLPGNITVKAEEFGRISVSFDQDVNKGNGTIEYKDTDGNWNVVENDIRNINATAIRVSFQEGFQFANHVALRDNGADILNDDGVRDALFSDQGYQIANDKNLELEHVYYQTGNGGDPEPQEFSGNAFFVWKDGDKLCKCKIEGLIGGGMDGYPVNYILEADVADGENKLEISNLNENEYYWVWENQEEKLNELTSWSDFENYLGELEFDYWSKKSFVIDPTQARSGANVINTNGDRCFRAAIIDESNYVGITFGVNEDDYTYFLADWDPTFINSTIDISGTTKEEPAVYESYMLEPNLKFSVDQMSSQDIVSVEAIDVNPAAVDVVKNGEEYTITFNSNFYDKVEFKMTDANGGEYYFEVDRIVAYSFDTMRATEDRDENIGVGINLVYPETMNHEDFEVIAVIKNADGSEETISVDPTEDYDRMGGANPEELVEFDSFGGKGLACTNYVVPLKETSEQVYFTILKKDALEGADFGGVFAGSGKGIEVDTQELVSDFYNRSELQ